MIAETVFKNIVKERRIVTPAGNMYWLDKSKKIVECSELWPSV